ncbi:MAG: EAL domain-containing protein [Psychrobium sp.]|nr:EAL domain-containing protein [Psychrobium sp.]
MKSIVTFSHALKIKVVAEYVSSQEIFDKLTTIGVDFFQGYYFDIPSCLEEQ